MKLLLVVLLGLAQWPPSSPLPSSAAPPTPLAMAPIGGCFAKELGVGCEGPAQPPPVCADGIGANTPMVFAWSAVPSPQNYVQTITNNKVAQWIRYDYEVFVQVTPPACTPVGACTPLVPPPPTMTFGPRTKATDMAWTSTEGGKICFSVIPMGSYYYVY